MAFKRLMVKRNNELNLEVLAKDRPENDLTPIQSAELPASSKKDEAMKEAIRVAM